MKSVKPVFVSKKERKISDSVAPSSDKSTDVPQVADLASCCKARYYKD